MRDGDELLVRPDGIELSRGRAAALGLTHNSLCFGQWVEGRRGRGRSKMYPRDDKSYDPEQQGSHLILSVIHPDKWPAAFAIEARLQRSPGAMRRFLGDLARIGVNILLIDSSASGYNADTAYAICELPKLSADVQRRLGQLSSQLQAISAANTKFSPEEIAENRLHRRRLAFQDIGRRVYSAALAVELELRLGDASYRQAQTFLHRPTVTCGWSPWFNDRNDAEQIEEISILAQSYGLLAKPGLQEREISPEFGVREYREAIADKLGQRAHATAQDVGKEPPPNRDPHLGDGGDSAIHSTLSVFDRHAHPAVSVRALTTLAYARVWRVWDEASANAFEPIEFKYDARKQLLAISVEPPVSDETGPSTAAANDRRGDARVHRELQQLTNNTEGPETWKQPLVGLGSFNRAERSLRLRLLRDWFADSEAAVITVNYEFDRASASEQRGPGLLHRVVDGLSAPLRYKIERVTNSLLYSSPQLERGRMRLVIVNVRRSEEDERNPQSRAFDVGDEVNRPAGTRGRDEIEQCLRETLDGLPWVTYSVEVHSLKERTIARYKGSEGNE